MIVVFLLFDFKPLRIFCTYILFSVGLFMSFSLSSQPFTVRMYSYERDSIVQVFDNVQLGEQSDFNSFLSAFRDSMVAEAYLDFSVDSVKKQKEFVDCYIYTGRPYIIKDLYVSDMTKKELRKAGIKRKQIIGLPFSELIVRDIQSKAVRYFADNAHPFCVAFPEFEITDENRVLLKICIEKKQPVVFSRIHVKGELKSSSKFIINYFNLETGKPYNESLIEAVSDKTDELEYLTMIRPPSVDFKDGKADVYLYPKEHSAAKFSGLVGFAPDSSNNNRLRITGELDFEFKNLFGRGESMAVRWQRIDVGAQLLVAKFRYPYIFSLPLEPYLNLAMDKTDSSFFNLEYETGLAYLFPNNNKILLSYSFFRSEVLNAEASGMNDASHSFFNIGYVARQYDYTFNPSQGFALKAIFGSGTRNAEEIRQSIFRTDLSINYYHPLYKALTFRAFIQHRSLYTTEKLTENELYKFGGYNSMRGFDENLFSSKNYTRLSAELRLRYERDAAVYPFYDYGFFFTADNQVKFIQAFGIGGEISTKAGRFTISYALGKQQNIPLKLADSKIHIAFVNRF